MTVSAFLLTNPGSLAVEDGTIDLGAGAFSGVLVLSAHTPSLANDNIYSDISVNECADGDYADTVATLTVSEAAGVVTVDMAQVDYGASVTIGARYFYIVQGTAGALGAGDLILGYMDLNDGQTIDVESIASDFKVDANASGLYTKQAA